MFITTTCHETDLTGYSKGACKSSVPIDVTIYIYFSITVVTVLLDFIILAKIH